MATSGMTSRPAGKINKQPTEPYRLIGLITLLILALIGWLVLQQYYGNFTPKAKITMLAPRAGLVIDQGSKITYHGAQIGRVANIEEIDQDGQPAAKFTLDVDPRFLKVIPANVEAKIVTTTLFGGKYVYLSSPVNPQPARLKAGSTIDARSVTTEINTILETVVNINKHIDPIKLNLTLGAAAQALTGLGDKFGEALVNADVILDQLIAQEPQARHDIKQFGTLADIYASAAPDLFPALDNVVITARTLNSQQKELDAALLAAAGAGNTGADVLGRGGPYLEAAVDNLIDTTGLLDEYSPSLGCTVRKAGLAEPKLANVLGAGDGYALDTNTQFLGGTGLTFNPNTLIGGLLTLGIMTGVSLIGGVQNPYFYPANLPRTNARGGPGGAPGCWAEITRELWPGPYLVIDTGVSLAPYNHLDTGSPLGTEYVWGRQWGENTINP